MTDAADTAPVLAQLAMTALSTVVAFLRWLDPTVAPLGGDSERSRLLRWSLDLFVGGAVVVVGYLAVDTGAAAPVVVGLGALTGALVLIPVALHACVGAT